MPQSIIVYRNPLEPMFWEALLSSPLTWPIMVSIGVFVTVAWFVATQLENRKRWRKGPWSNYMPGWRNAGNVALVTATIAAVATFWAMV